MNDNDLRIYQVPESRRYWVVRAESGSYFDHFNKAGVIALGHLNFMELEHNTDTPLSFDWDTLRGNYERHKEAREIKRGTRTAHLGQVKSFLYDMKPDDWVITVGNSAVRFGRIISNAYIDRKPFSVIYDIQTGRSTEMDLHLRRKVVWGPIISRKNLPYGLLISLKANQTLFSLDSKWEAIYHTLYPAFIRKNKLYLSLKIKTQARIKNRDISALFNLLNEIEVLGKELASGNFAILDFFDPIFDQYVEYDQLTLTTKAQFHSPGEIWNAITSTVGHLDHWASYTVLVYSMLFGNKKTGFDGLIDIDTRRKLWDLMIDRIKKNHASQTIESLQVELPRVDTSRLEGPENDGSEN